MHTMNYDIEKAIAPAGASEVPTGRQKDMKRCHSLCLISEETFTAGAFEARIWQKVHEDYIRPAKETELKQAIFQE